MCIRRLGIFVLLLLAPSLAAAQRPEPSPPQVPANELVKRAIQKELDDTGRDLHFMYRLHKKTPERTETRECLETNDGTLARVIAINDQPLTPEQQQLETQRLERYLSEPDKWTRRQKAQKEDTDRVHKMVAALPQAFNYTYAGADSSDGRQLVRLSFQPNPQFVPPTHELRVYTGMQGMMWIDSVSTRLVRIDAKLFRDVDFGWGILGRLYKGGSFEIEQRELGEGRWETTKTILNFEGKALMVKALHIKVTETLSDFRRAPDKLTLADGIHLLEKYDPAQETIAEQNRRQQNGGGAALPK